MPQTPLRPVSVSPVLVFGLFCRDRMRGRELGHVSQPLSTYRRNALLRHLSQALYNCAEKLAGQGSVRYQAADSRPPSRRLPRAKPNA